MFPQRFLYPMGEFSFKEYLGPNRGEDIDSVAGNFLTDRVLSLSLLSADKA
jgi:hypothetical protein